MEAQEPLSPWWRHGVILTMTFGFTVLIWLAVRTYEDAPPIPNKIVDPAGAVVFTGQDIRAGQSVFLKYGLMENGTVWGHGAYLGPDFSAQYLHTLSEDTQRFIASQQFHWTGGNLTPLQRDTLMAAVGLQLKANRYNPLTETLQYTEPETRSFQNQIHEWTSYFSDPAQNRGLSVGFVNHPAELRSLIAFFAWSAWASAADRPGKDYSYTNNFPYDPSLGNTPSGDAVLWSALSLIALLAGTALALFALGRFDFLGWKGKNDHVHPKMLPGVATESQKATIKYFVIVALLFLLQVLVAGGVAHYRADPRSFYGIDITHLFPSNLLRTWHLQLAIFWVATAYIAGGLFLAPSIGGKEPEGQSRWVNVLFLALLAVALGSLFGEMLGLRQFLGKLWFWFGDQGWEYLDLGRGWQVLLAVGLFIWVVLLFRALQPAQRDPAKREVSSLFLYSAIAIPLFYLPAMFFKSTTNFSVVDLWRFWIIHLWVEGFFELFVTVMVAVIFYQLGIITHITAQRVVYLDALLYLGSGIIGTGHHWYWTGQSNVTMAFGAVFSAMEVVPLTLLTLDAWDFVKLTRGKCDVCHQPVSVPHKWTFYFLMAVGFWNFVGAGVFGFLINLPIVSYFEVGTLLTPNHGHAAMMGVFGMLALALMVFTFRQVLTDEQWKRPERYISISFWGLNIGLALMVITNLFPGGVLQLRDALTHGYWHARSPLFLNETIVRIIEWLRLPGDLVFLVLGAVPAVIAALITYNYVRESATPIH